MYIQDLIMVVCRIGLHSMQKVDLVVTSFCIFRILNPIFIQHRDRVSGP